MKRISLLWTLLPSLILGQLFSQPQPTTFSNEAEEKEVFAYQAQLKKSYGQPQHLKRYNTTKQKETVFMQNTGRKRLYDHNLFLRALFQGQLERKGKGGDSSLLKTFQKAVFVDIGSAILNDAPTVKDIFEDQKIMPYLSQVIATDINDTSSAQTRFVEIYRQKKQQLPFEVKEIPLALTELAALQKITQLQQPLILRSVNSGVDLFYSRAQLQAHLQMLTGITEPILYFLAKFILYKPRNGRFEIAATFDESVYHSSAQKWQKLDWDKRSLNHGYTARSFSLVPDK